MRNRRIALVIVGTVAVAALAGFTGAGEKPLERLNLPGRGDALPFSHAIVAGDTIYVAGTLGLEAETGKPPTDATAEAKLALDGIRNKLRLAGADMDDLVSIQIFCPDLELYDEFNAVYRTYFDSGFPTRSFIGSGPLLRGARFEINGVAVRR